MLKLQKECTSSANLDNFLTSNRVDGDIVTKLLSVAEDMLKQYVNNVAAKAVILSMMQVIVHFIQCERTGSSLFDEVIAPNYTGLLEQVQAIFISAPSTLQLTILAMVETFVNNIRQVTIDAVRNEDLDPSELTEFHGVCKKINKILETGTQGSNEQNVLNKARKLQKKADLLCRLAQAPDPQEFFAADIKKATEEADKAKQDAEEATTDSAND